MTNLWKTSTRLIYKQTTPPTATNLAAPAPTPFQRPQRPYITHPSLLGFNLVVGWHHSKPQERESAWHRAHSVLNAWLGSHPSELIFCESVRLFWSCFRFSLLIEHKHFNRFGNDGKHYIQGPWTLETLLWSSKPLRSSLQPVRHDLKRETITIGNEALTFPNRDWHKDGHPADFNKRSKLDIKCRWLQYNPVWIKMSHINIVLLCPAFSPNSFCLDAEGEKSDPQQHFQMSFSLGTFMWFAYRWETQFVNLGISVQLTLSHAMVILFILFTNMCADVQTNNYKRAKHP